MFYLLEDIRNNLLFLLERESYSIVGEPKVRNTNADISFRLWKDSLARKTGDDKSLEKLKSNKFSSLSIDDITVEGDTINVNLNRTSTFLYTLQRASEGIKPVWPKKELSIRYHIKSSKDDLTDYRVSLLAQTIENLSTLMGYEIVENALGNKLYLSSKSNFSTPLESDQKLILCGSVVNAVKKNKETMSVSDVKRLKKKILLQDMEERDKMNEEVASLLADAVLKFDLLCVKLSKNVSLNTSKGDSTASDRAIFILYNYSRLNAILHEYESRVCRNYYPPTPPIEEIDWSVLKKDDEWKLLRDFVMYFPNVLLETISGIYVNRMARPHLLCRFLYALARAVSSYYRSTKILLDAQPSLMKITVARVQLVKAIHRILHQGLKLLNIEPIPAL